jgi:hypothetical protein
MCSTVEFAGAKMNGASVSGSAWALPVFSELHAGSSANVREKIIGQLVSPLYYGTCAGWDESSVSYYAPSIDSTGGISFVNCTTVNQVACCK